VDEPEVPSGLPRALLRGIISFAWLLRSRGLPAGMGRTVSFVRAVGELDACDRDAMYWAGRLTLCSRPEHIQIYDEAFDEFWLGAGGRPGFSTRLENPALDDLPSFAPVPTTRLAPEIRSIEGEAGEGEGDDEEEMLQAALRYSPDEALRHRDFSTLDEAEMARARELMARMRLAVPMRRSRRTRRAGKGRLDFAGTSRRSMRSLGEPLEWEWRRKSSKARRIVFLCDISGSMSDYTQGLLLFLQSAVQAGRRVEAFCFGTRLTRITRELAQPDVREAMRKAAEAVQDWSGGTRIGESLREFNDRWGQRGMARGAVIVILSDGWDTGRPEVVAEQVGRMKRLAHRVVWLNPLKATAGYQPLVRGMAAALPELDEFMAGNSLAALDAFLVVLKNAELSRGRVVR